MRYAIGVLGRGLVGLLAMVILSVVYVADGAKERLQSAKNRGTRTSQDDHEDLARV